jgi:hypothetical protein
VEHGDDALLYGPVGTLRDSILLRPGPDRVLSLDPMLWTEVIHLCAHILPSLVLPQSLDLVSSLSLSPSLELLEVEECFWLLHEVDSPEPAGVINEGDPVPVARVRGNFDGAMQVRVDELQELGWVMGGGGEGISHHLASQTGLTDGIRLGGRGDLETSDQVVSDHLLEDRIAGVAEATMPKIQVHGKSGGRGEVGSLWDGDGGALEISHSRWIGLGNKEGVSILLKCHGIPLNGDGEPLVEREVEDREEVVPEVWDIEDICELNLLSNLTINDRLEEDCAFALGVDGWPISQLDLYAMGSEVPDPVSVFQPK